MNAIEILKNKGLKKSAQRILIINILQKNGIPLTENEIKEQMGDMYDRITFYRSVNVLLESDIIHRINIDNITTKYALNTNHHHHKNNIHFFCKKCHSVTCIDDSKSYNYNLPTNYQIEEIEILIKGICDKCKQEFPA